MRMRGWIVVCLVIALVVLVGQFVFRPDAAWSQDDDADIIAPNDINACLECHEGDVDLKLFSPSAHGARTCQSCHKGVDRYPHPEDAIAKKPDCNTCHSNRTNQLTKSVHGSAKNRQGKTPPTCQSCHGSTAHEIPKVSNVSIRQKEASCRNCHANKANALAGSVHRSTGVAQPRGAQGRGLPGCLSCHGANPHAISEPAKTPSVKQDAGCLQCHTGVNAKMLSSAHGNAGKVTPNQQFHCLPCHGNDGHSIPAPKRYSAEEKSSLCADCHDDHAKSLAASIHGNVNMQTGNRPNCLTCHGENFHSVVPAAKLAPEQTDKGCRQCHTSAATSLGGSVHGGITLPKGKSPPCLSCHGNNAHKVAQPSALSRAAREAGCKSCHADLSKHLPDDVHNRPDKQPGDHPTCITCHGGKAHLIGKPGTLTSKEKVALCSNCHADSAMMQRYGLTTDSVDAYKRTYHGRAVLRFNRPKAATCTDCHGLHGILAADHPDAPVTPRHTAAICGKCHEKNMTFAFSYASHMRLKVERSIVDPFAKLNTAFLIFGAIFCTLGLMALGTGRIFFRQAFLRSSRRWLDVFDGISLLLLLSALSSLATLLLMRFMKTFESDIAWPASLILLALVVVAQVFRRLLFPRDVV